MVSNSGIAMYDPLLQAEAESANATELTSVQASSPISPHQPLTASATRGSISTALSPSLSGGAGSPHCRYCLGRNQSLNYSEDRESLIGPCRCKGTMGLVHPGCLMRWLQVSRKYRCELCGFDLRQCERLDLGPDEDDEDSDGNSPSLTAGGGGGARAAGDPAAVPMTDTVADGRVQPVPGNMRAWLRRPEQACCAAMTACCLLLVAPMIGVLVFFLTELRRQTAVSGKPQQDYQVVLFELLTGFVTVAVAVWLVYGSVTCAFRYRAWRWELRSHREVTAIVSIGEQQGSPVTV